MTNALLAYVLNVAAPQPAIVYQPKYDGFNPQDFFQPAPNPTELPLTASIATVLYGIRSDDSTNQDPYVRNQRNPFPSGNSGFQPAYQHLHPGILNEPSFRQKCGNANNYAESSNGGGKITFRKLGNGPKAGYEITPK